jgi:nicotinate-nucleotide pyrophosphorylase (carboxylating)
VRRSFRACEKWAVKCGGENHRFALYDMIMLNHNDFAGGIMAITKKSFFKANNLDLKL